MNSLTDPNRSEPGTLQIAAPHNLKDVLDVIAVAFMKLAPSNDWVIPSAWKALDDSFARGRRTGVEEGRKAGYAEGYAEGFSVAMAEKIISSIANKK